MAEAPRRYACLCQGLARGACLSLALVASGAAAQGLESAVYTEPTDRYAHAVLGDALEWGALEMRATDGRMLRIRLPEERVFEDTEPRLVDIDLDGDQEVMVVETLASQGARLSIYDEDGLVAATPYIGRTFRWLAPVGAADLDGDGFVEVAYIDRPHLAKTLRIWRFQNGGLVEVAQAAGLTNHRIGEADIAGGLRNCGTGPMMITANANWTRLIASTLKDGKIVSRDIGPHDGRESFARALTC